MVMQNKKILIEKLTGVHSSKKSYYVALKKKIFETTKRNTQLEIINHLAKSIGIEMSIQEIIENVTPRLQTLFNYQSLQLSLCVVENNNITCKAVHQNTAESTPASENRPSVDPATAGVSNSDLNRTILKVIQSQKPLYLPASSEDDRKSNTTPADKVTWLFLPLRVKNLTRGVLAVRCEEGIEINDCPFFEQLADQLAVCLENARLYSELLRSKREWEITFSAVNDLLIFIDRDYAIRRVNPAAIEFFTMPEKEILGSKCYHLLYGRDEKCNPCIGEQVLQSQKTSYLQSRTRHNRVLDIFAYPAFTEKGEPYGVTYYAKDVTRLIDSIKLASMGEMSAGMAHELNSPLTAIVGNSQLLIRETVEENPHYQLIKDIHSSGIRCQRIIKNLLTFSRQDEFSFEDTDINDIIDSATALATYQIQNSRVKLNVKKDGRIPKFSGSPSGLEQIVVNLILNAKDAVEEKLRFNEKFEGEITVTTSLHPDKEVIIVTVADNGAGITKEHIPQIFNPFYTTKKLGSGTGLGLSVSLGIAQAHGGFIDVKTVKGEGSTFSLILPLAKDARAIEKPARKKSR